MKRISALLTLLLSLTLFCIMGVSASAENADWKINFKDNSYLLLCGTDIIDKSESFTEIFDILPNGACVELDNITLAEPLTITKALTLSGTLTSSFSIGIEGDGSLSFKSLSLNLRDGATLKVRGGTLSIADSSIRAESAGAISLDYASSSSLLMHSGSVSTNNSESAINIKKGTATFLGGSVECEGGSAIENRGTLTLGRRILFNSSSFDIVTYEPVWLSSGGEYFAGLARVKYMSQFEKGDITPVFYSSCPESLNSVELYDINGKREELSYFDTYRGIDENEFLAVYKPYKLTYMCDGVITAEEQLLAGELPTARGLEERLGYRAGVWCEDEDCLIPYNFAEPINSDLTLFSRYYLDAPSFSLCSLSTEYSGDDVTLSFTELFHPLSEQGFYSYVWLNADGEEVANTKELNLKYVSDSGSYKCIITFTCGRDIAIAHTPYVTVQINKRVLDTPLIESTVYCGREQYPSFAKSSLYTSLNKAYVDSGTYDIEFTLQDPDNYSWRESESNTVTAQFIIERATNEWMEEISVYDTYFGAELKSFALALYGNVSFLYSESALGEYSDAPPKAAGTYYVKAIVPESANWYYLESEPRPFSILEDTPISLNVLTPPEKSVYTAFELFDRSGISFSVIFKSGASRILTAYDVSVYYQSGNCVRYGDTAVIAEYMGLRVIVPITVHRAKYDLQVSFDDLTVTYDGRYKSIELTGELPTGKDGIPLVAHISGGGTDSGSYEVKLEFSSAGVDYELPPSRTATLIIEPLAVRAVFGECDFVYDNSVKCPDAYFINAYGARVELKVSGGAVNASDSYIAVASLSDKNYILLDAECPFRIAKAQLDMSSAYLSESSFVYDGTVKRVELLGLPSGVSVIGYTDNFATDFGEYSVLATLLYDSLNYSEPKLPELKWRIERADYDLGYVSFSDSEYVYDGLPHYPTVFGEMPRGIDGSELKYSFSHGVKDVVTNDGWIEISFSTDSRNYNTPKPIFCRVTILPLGIEVEWNNTKLVYNGEEQSPTATAGSVPINVIGGMTNAGSYKATAVSADPNYYVLNNTSDFLIAKAENIWLSTPSIPDIFFSGELIIYSEALVGEASCRFYLDSEMNEEITLPSDVGVYYALVYVPESENYTELTYTPVCFRIIEIAPISISAVLGKSEYYAFELLSLDDFAITAKNNDGSYTPVDNSSVRVVYESSSSFRVRDKRVKFEYSGLFTECEIKVLPAIYDMSGVAWENTEFIYDGSPKTPTLIGLPEGVSVIEYVGGGAVNAGEYRLAVKLAYDSENYCEPIVEGTKYKIAKERILPQILGTETYDGTPKLPEVVSNLYKISDTSGFVSCGNYTVSFQLTNPDNYEFIGNGTAEFTILPRNITIKINDIDVYMFEDEEPTGFTVVDGTLTFGDVLTLEYTVRDGTLTAISKNPNYSVNVIDGKINYLGRPEPKLTRALFICLLLFVIITAALLLFIKNKERILVYASSLSKRVRETGKSHRISNDAGPMDIKEKTVMSIDALRADELITDTIAKTLIRKNEGKIYTRGKRRAIINVDTLSESFDTGAIIDINILKERGLIPKDSLSLKVLARGSIDKPLRVFANDFSIQAVKMIALTGGEVNRIPTARIKKSEKE